MNKKKQTRKNTLDKIRWCTVFFIFAIIILLNFYFKEINYFANLSIFLILIVSAITLFFFTLKGKAIISFILHSKMEAKKVLWPSNQETFHTTLIIAAITVVMSLIFWGLDTVLVMCISFFTTLRL